MIPPRRSEKYMFVKTRNTTKQGVFSAPVPGKRRKVFAGDVRRPSLSPLARCTGVATFWQTLKNNNKTEFDLLFVRKPVLLRGAVLEGGVIP